VSVGLAEVLFWEVSALEGFLRLVVDLVGESIVSLSRSDSGSISGPRWNLFGVGVCPLWASRGRFTEVRVGVGVSIVWVSFTG